MPRRDQALLLDMLIACRKIQRFSTGLTRDTLATNEMAEYFRADLDILWSTIEDSIPPLIDQLDTILSSNEEDEDS